MAERVFEIRVRMAIHVHAQLDGLVQTVRIVSEIKKKLLEKTFKDSKRIVFFSSFT
jgi:hypothetical protein